MTDAEADAAADPREAFSLLAHDLRLDIVLASLADWRGSMTDPRSYSDLMAALDMQDSGKFNYHLQSLLGTYLRETDGGYVPTASATALYRSVLAMRPTAAPARTDLAVDSDCPDCGSGLSALYEHGFFVVRCPACEHTVDEFTIPFPVNGLADRTDAEVVAAVHQRTRHHVSLGRTGQCPHCAGTTTTTVLPDDAPNDVRISCDTCSWLVVVPFLFALGAEPRVGGALAALGLSPDDHYMWELPAPTVTEADGRYVLSVEAAGATATLRVDDDLAVRSVTVDGASIGD